MPTPIPVRQTAVFDDVLTMQGTWDPATGSFPTVTPSGRTQPLQKGAGYVFISSGFGLVDSHYFIPGDMLIAIVDEPSSSTLAGNWTKVDAADTSNLIYVTKPSHGLGLGTGPFKSLYQDDLGNFLVADSTTGKAAELHLIGVQGDTLILQQSGFINVFGHGLTPGVTQWLGAGGNPVSTKPANAQRVAQAVDLNRILLYSSPMETAPITNGVYSESFTAADAGWVLDSSNSVYRRTITQAALASGGVSTVTATALWDTTTGDQVDVGVDALKITSGGDLVIEVTDIPDGRFAGIVHAFDDNVATGLTSYSATFDATADWGAASGGYYTITIPATTHNVAVPRVVSVWETIGVERFLTTVDQLIITASGDIQMKVIDTPDSRFAGEVFVY